MRKRPVAGRPKDYIVFIIQQRTGVPADVVRIVLNSLPYALRDAIRFYGRFSLQGLLNVYGIRENHIYVRMNLADWEERTRLGPEKRAADGGLDESIVANKKADDDKPKGGLHIDRNDYGDDDIDTPVLDDIMDDEDFATIGTELKAYVSLIMNEDGDQSGNGEDVDDDDRNVDDGEDSDVD